VLGLGLHMKGRQTQRSKKKKKKFGRFWQQHRLVKGKEQPAAFASLGALAKFDHRVRARHFERSIFQYKSSMPTHSCATKEIPILL